MAQFLKTWRRDIPYEVDFMAQVPKRDSVTFLLRSTLWPSAAGENFEVYWVVVCYKSVLAPVTLSFGSAGHCINVFNAVRFYWWALASARSLATLLLGNTGSEIDCSTEQYRTVTLNGYYDTEKVSPSPEELPHPRRRQGCIPLMRAWIIV